MSGTFFCEKAMMITRKITMYNQKYYSTKNAKLSTLQYSLLVCSNGLYKFLDVAGEISVVI